MNKRFESVWDAIEDNPVDAEKMKLRSRLMMVLSDFVESEVASRRQTAKKLCVAQARLSDLMRGKISLFELEDLIDMLTLAGLRIEMRVARIVSKPPTRDRLEGVLLKSLQSGDPFEVQPAMVEEVQQRQRGKSAQQTKL